jgi:hypothetical protein
MPVLTALRRADRSPATVPLSGIPAMPVLTAVSGQITDPIGIAQLLLP